MFSRPHDFPVCHQVIHLDSEDQPVHTVSDVSQRMMSQSKRNSCFSPSANVLLILGVNPHFSIMLKNGWNLNEYF